MVARTGVVIATAALLVVGAAGARPFATFTDATGDTDGPDIQSVEITHDATTLNVDVRFANRQRLAAAEAVEVAIDLDSNAATGEEGIDLDALYVEGDPAEVLLWQTDDFVETNQAQITWGTGEAHVRVPLSLVRGNIKVAVSAIGFAPDPVDPDEPLAEDPFDAAPDEGTFAYRIERHRLSKATLTFAPTKPRAGKAFRLRGASLQLVGLSGAVKASTSCTATLGGKRFGKGCSWKLPRNAKRKAFVVKIVATYAGDQFTVTRRFRVG